MEKIIVLSGVANAGKTNTLNTLAEMLSTTPGVRLLFPVKMPSNPDWHDYDHDFFFEVSVGGVIKCVAIITKGDSGQCLQPKLNAVDNFSRTVDIVFAACRSYWSSSVEEIENWALKHAIIPDYVAIMLKPNTKQNHHVVSTVADRLRMKIN